MRRFSALLAALIVATLPRVAPAQADDAEGAESTAGSEEEATGTPAGDDSTEPRATAPRPRAPAPEDDAEEPEPAPVEPASDTLSGHFTASASAAYALPFASLAENASQSAVLGSGAGYGLELGYGVSRTVVFGLWGQLEHFGAGDVCTSCSGSSFAGGPFLRYHIVQGVRFDPWMEVGAGYRSTKITGTNPDSSWSGIEWLHLAVGGDWYAFDKLGFGPFMEMDMGVYGSRPAGAVNHANHWQFLTGARLTFDLPGK